MAARLRAEFPHALRSGQLVAYFQPEVELSRSTERLTELRSVRRQLEENRAELERVVAMSGLSRDTFEIASKSLPASSTRMR